MIRPGTFLLRPRVVAASFAVLSIAAGIQRVLLGPTVEGGRVYTHYNNYVLFRASFLHLVRGQDLYVLYPAEHWDLFKYSPTFAALMAPFAVLPDTAGVVLWGLLGSMALFVGLARLPVGTETSRMAAAWFVSLPMLQALQNTQSNAHVAGLVLLAAVWLECGAATWAALAIALGFFIKVYGVVALALVALYPCRRRTAAHFVLWMVGLAMLPLLFVPPSHLGFLYQSWMRLLATDQTASTGVSVMSWLNNWFGLDVPKTAASLAGLSLTLLPLVRVGAYADVRFRMRLLAALLIWMVIFNHKAEPNTFVIAVAGVAVWYLAGPRQGWRLALVASVFVFTGLSTTSIFPVVVRRSIIQPYSLRVVPCIAVWIVAVVEMSGLFRGTDAATAAPGR